MFVLLQIKVGTTDSKRTTVPFLYNMDGKVAGLDVIDFPGVDDKDHTIPELANLLLSLAQIVIFVVDYRYVLVCCGYISGIVPYFGHNVFNHAICNYST